MYISAFIKIRFFVYIIQLGFYFQVLHYHACYFIKQLCFAFLQKSK